MKKTTLSTLVCATILGTSMVSTTAVLAEESANYDTIGKISFEEDLDPTNPVNPVDPIDPSIPVDPINPIDPTIPVKPGTNGPLSMDYASSLNFGKQKITTVDKTYYANVQLVETEEGEKEARTNYVQVTDKRGSAKGWGLSVKQDAQFKTQDGDILTGAKITFLNGQLASVSESTAPSTVTPTFDLTGNGTGEMINVVSAEAEEGWGTWIYRFGDDSTKAESIQLDVPGKTMKTGDADYTTNITWTLTDIPDDIEEPEPEV